MTRRSARPHPSTRHRSPTSTAPSSSPVDTAGTSVCSTTSALNRFRTWLVRDRTMRYPNRSFRRCSWICFMRSSGCTITGSFTRVRQPPVEASSSLIDIPQTSDPKAFRCSFRTHGSITQSPRYSRARPRCTTRLPSNSMAFDTSSSSPARSSRTFAWMPLATFATTGAGFSRTMGQVRGAADRLGTGADPCDRPSAQIFDDPEVPMQMQVQMPALRAPEVVLKLRYGPPIDIWSVGCMVGARSRWQLCILLRILRP